MYLELIRFVVARLKNKDPELLDMKQWRQLLAIAQQAVGAQSDMWPEWERELRQFNLTWTAPEIPENLWPRFREMAAPLAKLPLYAPYLEAYGLAPT
jgi:hypothetical protein